MLGLQEFKLEEDKLKRKAWENLHMTKNGGFMAIFAFRKVIPRHWGSHAAARMPRNGPESFSENL